MAGLPLTLRRTSVGTGYANGLIDQRVAVANLLSLFDTGQRVPQRQQSLGAERGRVQLPHSRRRQSRRH
jgi:hypothetical protein